jgi:hypothetical protein
MKSKNTRTLCFQKQSFKKKQQQNCVYFLLETCRFLLGLVERSKWNLILNLEININCVIEENKPCFVNQEILLLLYRNSNYSLVNIYNGNILWRLNE